MDTTSRRIHSVGHRHRLSIAECERCGTLLPCTSPHGTLIIETASATGMSSYIPGTNEDLVTFAWCQPRKPPSPQDGNADR